MDAEPVRHAICSAMHEPSLESNPLAKQDHGKKEEFGVQGLLDVAGGPEAVLLTLEKDVGGGNSFLPQGSEHPLGLTGRHNFVLAALKKDDRRRQ